MTQTATQFIEFAPDTWNNDQSVMHSTRDLNDAMYKASCLAGGWYRRPVTIYMQITPDLNEIYQMRPSDAPRPDGWRRVYTITAHSEDR